MSRISKTLWAACKDTISYIAIFIPLLATAFFFVLMCCLILSGHLFWFAAILIIGVFIGAIVDKLTD